MEDELSTDKSQPYLQRRHFVFIGIVVVVLAAAIYLGQQIRKEEPNFYTPGRSTLVNAKQKLKESLYHENASIRERRLAHQEIDAAIADLAKAQNLDSADRSNIEQLLEQLKRIEIEDQRGEISQNKLQQMYVDLLEQIDVMVKRLEEYPR